MSLQPLEFSDCLLDSPFFKEHLGEHEEALENTYQQVKRLARKFSDLNKAQAQACKIGEEAADMIAAIKFPAVGEKSEDEVLIDESLQLLANLIRDIEAQQLFMVEQRQTLLVAGLEDLLERSLRPARDARTKFKSNTERYASAVEKNCRDSKKRGTEETDRQQGQEELVYVKQSTEHLQSLMHINAVNKFELPEKILASIYIARSTHHQIFEWFKEYETFMGYVNGRLQDMRTLNQTEDEMMTALRKKTLGEYVKRKTPHPGLSDKVMRGYLLVQRRKGPLINWPRQFCQFDRQSRLFTIYTTSGSYGFSKETFTVTQCNFFSGDYKDRLFCFEVAGKDQRFVVQAQSSVDYDIWSEMFTSQSEISSDIVQPQSKNNSQITNVMKNNLGKLAKAARSGSVTVVEMMNQGESGSKDGFSAYGHTRESSTTTCRGSVSGDQSVLPFDSMVLERLINLVTECGLHHEGIYRVSGAQGKVQETLAKVYAKEKVEFGEEDEGWRLASSAVRKYLRDLETPIVPFFLYDQILSATKIDNYENRMRECKQLIKDIPSERYEGLKLLCEHLHEIAAHEETNRMQASNLGVVFGPSLLRPVSENMAAIYNIKYQNQFVTSLIQYSGFFFGNPEDMEVPPQQSVRRSIMLRHASADISKSGEKAAQIRGEAAANSLKDVGMTFGKSDMSQVDSEVDLANGHSKGGLQSSIDENAGG